MEQTIRTNSNFSTSNIIKKICTVLIFIISISVSIYILLKLDSFPLASDEINRTIWYISLIGMLWTATAVINYNLHVSFFDRFTSYVWSIIMLSYVLSIVFIYSDIKPDSWNKTIDNYYLYLPIIGIDILWKMTLVLLEWKTRPMFVKRLLLISILKISLGIISWFIAWSLKEYLIEGKTYDYLDAENIAVWFIGGLLFMLGITLIVIITSKYKKIGKTVNRINKKVAVWNIFLWLFSVSIWALIQFSMNEWDNYLLINIIASIVALLMISLGVFLRIRKNYQRALLFILIISWQLCAAITFININVFESNHEVNFSIFMLITIVIYFVIVFANLSLPLGFISLYKLTTFLITIQVLLIWTGSQLFVKFDVFEFNEIIFFISLGSIQLILINIVISQLYTSWKINSSVRRIENKITINNEGVKNE